VETIRVFVGADRSQALAIRVLEHSIRRHTSAPVEVIPMIDLPVPTPRDPKQRQRTGFSFSRFCIPKLAGYQGRAVYMDADMLVMRDMGELWNLPMQGHKVLIQEELDLHHAVQKKTAAPTKRIKQCAVMILDCANLDWKVEAIVRDLDEKKYTYEDLVYQLCILAPNEIGFSIPFEWNSLETLTPRTGNIHYTDMPTQPWVYASNQNDGVWIEEVRLMLQNGLLTEADLAREVELGFFRPSLPADVQYRHRIFSAFLPVWRLVLGAYDRWSGYQPHRQVYEANRVRMTAATAS
jgi:lipopolysaccharide biosynthesis glycosyltransferase